MAYEHFSFLFKKYENVHNFMMSSPVQTTGDYGGVSQTEAQLGRESLKFAEEQVCD